MIFKEKKLIFAFAFLILLTLLMGLFGISQIERLSRKIEMLGRHSLKLQNAVLEMRKNNAVYAMGIRNYVFWRASRFLGAVPAAINVKNSFEAADNFKNILQIYKQNTYLPQQKDMANDVGASFNEVVALGKKIVQAADADKEESGKISEATNSLLMGFENRIYKIDGVLDSSMSKFNLQEVERELLHANADKEKAILLLRFSLFCALALGILIAFSVYRRRIKDYSYRQQIFNRMVNVEEGERKKLSTAVHDEMGQDLSALKIYLGLISQGLSEVVSSRGGEAELSLRGGEADEAISLKSKVEQCKKITSGLIEKSHNIAFLLRPPDLDEVGLLESLESLLLESKQLSNTEYIFQKSEGKLELAPEYSLLVYRILQELLTNMVKHSKAKNVEVSISKKVNSVELYYHDDGLGFDYNQDSNKFLRRKEDKFKLGLVGLKERVEVLDGSMQINSSYGKGTRVSVMLPIR